MLKYKITTIRDDYSFLGGLVLLLTIVVLFILLIKFKMCTNILDTILWSRNYYPHHVHHYHHHVKDDDKEEEDEKKKRQTT